MVQVNLCQKLSFLNQLTHRMTSDSMNSPKNTSSETCCVQILFWMSKQKQNNFCKQHVLNLYFLGNSMNNILSYCGLTDARTKASEKDLPVQSISSWLLLAEIKWTVHVALPMQMDHNAVQTISKQSSQQVPRAYFPNIYCT